MEFRDISFKKMYDSPHGHETSSRVNKKMEVKATVTFCLTLFRIAAATRGEKMTSSSKIERNRALNTMWGLINTADMGGGDIVSPKALKTELSCDTAMLVLGLYPQVIKSRTFSRYLYTEVKAALFVVVKRWKQGLVGGISKPCKNIRT